MKTAADMAAAYQRGMANASQNYIAGINAVTVNPMQLAATDQAMQAYQNGVMRSVSSGRRAAALNAANPATWKTNAVTVGASRLVSGAQKAKPKVDAHFQKWQPIYAQASAAASALPKGGKPTQWPAFPLR
jgi:hypothetical protein